MADMNLFTRMKNGTITPKQLKQNIAELFQYAKTNGLSELEQDTVVGVILKMDLNEITCQNLILCLIPHDLASPTAVQETIIWILMNSTELEKITKINSLFTWIASLLDYHIVNPKVVDDYYGLLFPLVANNWKGVSHVLYILSKPDDVNQYRVNLLQETIARWEAEPHLCVLLRRLKELNSKFSHITIPAYKKCEKVFSSNDQFYNSLRDNFRNRNKDLSISSASIVVPFKKQGTLIRSDGDGLLPSMQYLENETASIKFDEHYIHNIKNGTELIKNFNKIVLPLNTLSLLNSAMGIRVLMLSKRTIQEQFLTNLYAVLEQNLLFRLNNVPTGELEILLNNVIRLHWMYQQGFVVVSRLLSLYLQSWDGYEFRPQIYKLLAWFVFKSNAELNRFVLRPLHTLFVSGDQNEQCDILLCLINLIRNLYSTMAKDELKFALIYEENVLKTRNELIPVIRSLTKFTAELCKLGLYMYPCNNQLLFVALVFYERVHELERSRKMPSWSIISSSVLYQSLFSFNAHLLNQTCGLLKEYRSAQQYSVENPNEKIKEKIRRLQSYAQDMFNILWTADAFVKRTQGHIFRGLSLEDEASWRNYTNLNNSLSLARHVMFTPYRMLKACENNGSVYSFSGEDVLDILRPHLPHLVDVIETIRGEEEEEDDLDSD